MHGLTVNTGSGNNYLAFIKADGYFCSQRQLVGYSNNDLTLIFPVFEGEVIKAEYVGISTKSLRFYYSVGAS